MQAVISGRAGAALLIDGEDWTSLHADDLADAIPRNPGDFPFLFGEADDLQFFENVDRKRVTKELTLACDRESSLRLALFVLDADLPSDVRAEAACELNTLLKKDGIADDLESTLYAQPLPESADVTGAAEACRGSACELVTQLFQELVDRQSSVREVRLAWNQIPIQHFGTDEDRRRAEATFVREGFFRRLVVAVGAGDTVEENLYACLVNSCVEAVPQASRILEEWVLPLRKRPLASLTLNARAAPKRVPSVPRTQKPSRRAAAARSAVATAKSSDRSSVDQMAKAILVLGRTIDYVLESRAVEVAVDKPLSSSKVQVLRLLAQRPGQTSSQVARYLGVSKPAVSQIIDAMVRSRLVTRKTSKHDRREVKLGLTDKGKNINKLVRQQQRHYIRNAMRSLDGTAANRWINTLSDIAVALGKADEAVQVDQMQWITDGVVGGPKKRLSRTVKSLTSRSPRKSRVIKRRTE